MAFFVINKWIEGCFGNLLNINIIRKKKAVDMFIVDF
jgi:hypothetical protein